ncbi:MAG: choice-of-anchor B family protein [Phycisphaerae bacterium]
MVAVTAQAQLPPNNVILRSHLTLPELQAGEGNDCWGYISPSNRQYALMGTNVATVVVEITNPDLPVIVGQIPHSASSWSDIKVFGTFAYAVNESGGGMDVIDLSNVDGGVVTLANNVTTSGLNTSHNVAINTDSGYLYLIGSNVNFGAPIVFDLNADPVNPPMVGRWLEPGRAYHHDAHIVNYTSGIYAGREIEFGFSEGRGLDILDVTDKSNIFSLSRTSYPNVSYCHQGWVTPDHKYLFADDELDEGSAAVPTTRTLIFDISDLSNPFLAATFTTGLPSRDHNAYVKDCILYEANYSSGLHVISIADPLNPVEVGSYDTYPFNDNVNWNGSWSVFPFFNDNIVIISDIDSGLFVVDVTPALAAAALLAPGLQFDYPTGHPLLIDSAAGATLDVQVTPQCGFDVVPGSGMLHYDDGTGFTAVPVQEFAPGDYLAAFPAITCGSMVSYYVSSQTSVGTTVTNPVDAPITVFTALSAFDFNMALVDNFELNQGWTTQILGATAGQWERGVPINDQGWAWDPASDADGSGQCFLTQNQLGNTDVDGGSVRLISPAFDLSAGSARVEYDYFLRMTDPNGLDFMLVEVSAAGAAGPWTQIALHDTDGGLDWRQNVIAQADLDAAGVTLTNNMMLRFTVTDGAPGSVVEAGLDGVTITSGPCQIVPPPVITAAASRVTHGAVADFDAVMAGGLILEGRLNGVTKLVINFDQPMDAATATAANVAVTGLLTGPYTGTTATALNGPADELTVTFNPALPDVDRFTVDLTGMTAAAGPLGLANPTFEVVALRGDVDANLSVTTGDASQVRFFFNQPADAANFRFDVDNSGAITTGDFSQVRFFFNNVSP